MSRKSSTNKKAATATHQDKQVIHLNSCFSYMEDLKKLVPFMVFDNYRTPIYKEVGGEISLFFGKISYRHAGYTDDFNQEAPKKQFRKLMMDFADLRVEIGQGKKLLRELADEVISVLDTKFYLPNSFHVFQNSLPLLQMCSQNNILLLPMHTAQKMNLLLVLQQNSLDLVVESFLLSEKKRRVASVSVPVRLYFFYEILVDLSLQSIRKGNIPQKSAKQTDSYSASLERDMDNASILRLPFLFPSLMYNRDLLLLMANAYMDYPDRHSFTETMLAPMLFPAACYLDSHDSTIPMVKSPNDNKSHLVHACFDMQRWLKAKSILFDNPAEQRKTVLYGRMQPVESLAPVSYHMHLQGKQSSVRIHEYDARNTILKTLDAEPFHVFVPRKFLCGLVTTFGIALHLSMWNWKLQTFTSYEKVEDLQFSLQMLHPSIGMNTSLFNHAQILHTWSEAVAEIVYSGNDRVNNIRSTHYTEFVNDLIRECALPTLPAARKASLPEEDPRETSYNQILSDLEPFVLEYFSLPCLHKHPHLKNPLMEEDTLLSFASMLPNSDKERSVDFDSACFGLRGECLQTANHFMQVLRTFPASSFQDFVNMQKFCL